ncbi:MAG: alpha-1,2-fucosyltransferase [Bacteroidetes bacterium]|nr:alpha-1,2-fucosyltransferase [Fibrella sp.]
MIIARITSGLGNQLFQYALARSLALRNDTSLCFDLSYYRQAYETDTVRAFRLDRFDIEYTALNASPYRYVSKGTRLLPNRTLKPWFEFVKERQFHFDPGVFEAQAKFVTLDGFWQSARYFADYETIIRKELTFNRPTGPVFETYKEEIDGSEHPISLHIRRGDYVSHPEFSQSFGFVGLDYYRAAIAYVIQRLPTARFFIFSDEPDWVSQHLVLDYPHCFVTSTGSDADLDDLQLMSLCRHHIIANSSFSWWGAWLNADAGKLVITPHAWFRNKPDWNTIDLIPATWLRL